MRYLGRGRGEGKQSKVSWTDRLMCERLERFPKGKKIVDGSAFGTSVAILLSVNRVINPTYQWKTRFSGCQSMSLWSLCC